jgi:ATPase subunit of ABC transporter with duplicated ATPase domains
LWLESFLTRGGVGKAVEVATKGPGTIVLVSHDRCFVENVATDVIVFEVCFFANRGLCGNFFCAVFFVRHFETPSHLTLTFSASKKTKDTKLVQYPCGLRGYEETVAQSARRLEALRDGSARQERHALDAAAHMRRQAARCKGGVNDSILKQAKQKVDKMERIGLYRQDGKSFKTHSLATLDEHAVRLPTKIQAAHAAREVIFDFPSPNTLARCSKFDTIIAVDNVSVGYSPSPPYLILEASIQVTPRTRAALVGDNGSGKTSLLLLLLGRLAPVQGHLVTLPGVEIGYVPQHHAEALPLDLTSAAYLSELFGVCEFEARKRLGKFGITGRTALLQMGSLSGGQVFPPLCPCLCPPLCPISFS